MWRASHENKEDGKSAGGYCTHMLKIRLRRVGAKKQPSYRIVIAESTAPRDGKFVESIGIYNPRTDPETVRIQEERALHWLSVGAQPTESVARIFRTHGTMDRFERLRGGEPVSALVAEAEASASTKAVDVPAEVVEEPEATTAVEAEYDDFPAEVVEEPEAITAEAESSDAPAEVDEEPEAEQPTTAASDETEESEAV
jgi:small subunit ribosomal protein S16